MANKKTTTNVKNNVVTKNVADEKKTVTAVKQEVKAAEPKKAEPVKTEDKPAEVKPVEVKKTEAKTEEVKSADAKKAEAKKPAAKKTVAKKEISQTVYVQYAGKNVAVDEMMPKIKKVWQKAGNKIKDINDVKLYVKPEDNKVYFVINEEFCDSVVFE